jgi:hypothetical protein
MINCLFLNLNGSVEPFNTVKITVSDYYTLASRSVNEQQRCLGTMSNFYRKMALLSHIVWSVV